MPRIVVTKLQDGAVRSLPVEAGLSATGEVTTREVLGADRAIHLWTHVLAPGAAIHWNRPSVGHMLFLWKGAMTVNGKPMADEGAVVVERYGVCEVTAGASGCELVEFHKPGDPSTLPGCRQRLSHLRALAARDLRDRRASVAPPPAHPGRGADLREGRGHVRHAHA
jgi:hypothetical protein